MTGRQGDNCRVLWGGAPLPTAWISPTLLAAAVPAANSAALATAFITVETPVSGVPDGGVAPGRRTVEVLMMTYLPSILKQD